MVPPPTAQRPDLRRAATDSYTELSRPHRAADCHWREAMALLWLSMSPDRRMRMGELAQLARGSMSRLSNVVKRLEERGFVQRAADPTNGRYTLAILTDAGWDVVVRAAPGHVRAVRRYVLDPLNEEQVIALQAIGGRIAERILDGATGLRPSPPPEDCPGPPPC